MSVPLIKICGVTSPADARAAVLAGADLVGLNFVVDSPRSIAFDRARVIAEATRGTHNPRRRRGQAVGIVAVFVDPPDALVEGVLATVCPDVLQFHGEEPPDFCAQWKVPFLKAFRLGTIYDADHIPEWLGPGSAGFLIDAFSAGAHGGTGRRLRPDLVRAGLAHPRGFLAGGLNPDNVAEAVALWSPYGVDVASGVEIRAGVKSERLMHAFVREVQAGAKRSG